MDLESLWERSRIIRETRKFFDDRGYLETDTPLLAPDLIPESCLEVFETRRILPPGSVPGGEESCWLVPSPEVWMKRLIARHRVNMYQICHCFRNGESSGRLHSPEFTMLEYYTMGADYGDSLRLTEDLFSHLARALPGGIPPELRPPFERITMEEAFSRWAGFSLERAYRGGTLAEEARRLGLDPPEGTGAGGLYDLVFIHAVEPRLPRDRPVALVDYPAFVPCLAKKKAGGTVERWELYVRGVELANCYSEETDPGEVRRFFEQEAAEKERSALVRHHVDKDYWRLFSPKLPGSGEARLPGGARGGSPDRPGRGEGEGFPPCSGAALGLDRLIMAFTGRSTIDGVLPFPMKAR